MVDREQLREAFVAGFCQSAEGFNGEILTKPEQKAEEKFIEWVDE